MIWTPFLSSPEIFIDCSNASLYKSFCECSFMSCEENGLEKAGKVHIISDEASDAKIKPLELSPCVRGIY